MELETLVKTITSSKKIAIFGWPATGKSTFSELLSKKLGLPLYHLDNIRWKNSVNGKKDEEQFLQEYNNILMQKSWIMEGNALDWISSRLEQADMLFYFHSCIEQSISLMHKRALKINKNNQSNFMSKFQSDEENFKNWIENRFSKKIDKLLPVFKQYHNKIYQVNNYDELNILISKINSIK